MVSVAYATPDDVQLRFNRELDSDERESVEVRLDDVEEMIRLRIPDLDAKIEDGSIRLRLVVAVECEAVLRLIRNPDGYTEETDGNYSYSISDKVASGKLTIEPDEWKLLGVKSGAALMGIRIMGPYGVRKNPNWAFESGNGLFPPCAIPERSDWYPGHGPHEPHEAVWA